MKLMSLFTLLLTLVLTTFAGPTTNRTEFEGDAKLTTQQQAEYTKKLELGIKFFDNTQYDLAEAEFKSILSFAPKKALAYFNLGLTKYKQGNFHEAIKNFDTVIKMRSYYVGAAFYYKSISQMNLEQSDAAVKTAQRYTQAHFFYKPSQELIQTIRTGSDEYFENAKVAAADENYELCLLEMDQSVLTDTAKGKALVTQCKLGLKSPEPTAAVVVQGSPLKAYYYQLYFDAHLSQTDNIYQEATDLIRKFTYFTEVGGEFILRNFVDTGIGFSYNQFNAIDLPRFKDETYNIRIPFYFRANKHRLSAEGFYNLSKYEGENSYNDTGLGLNYTYTEEKYLFGVYGSTLARTSLNSSFDYKSGTYNNIRFVASRFIDQFTISGNVGFEQTLSGDQPWGAVILPYAKKSTSLGLNLQYDFNQVSAFNVRSSYTTKDYGNRFAPNFTKRDDNSTNLVLAYQHKFNSNIKAYIQQSLIKNNSTYNETELSLNRNYTENITTLGLSLLTY